MFKMRKQYIFLRVYSVFTLMILSHKIVWGVIEEKVGLSKGNGIVSLLRLPQKCILLVLSYITLLYSRKNSKTYIIVMIWTIYSS